MQTIKAYGGLEVLPLIFDLCTRYRRVDKSLLLQFYSQENVPGYHIRGNLESPWPLLNFRRPDTMYTLHSAENRTITSQLCRPWDAITIIHTSWTFSDTCLFVKEWHLNPCYRQTSAFIGVYLPNLLYLMLSTQFWKFARNVRDFSRFSSRCPQKSLLNKNDNTERSMLQICDYLQL